MQTRTSKTRPIATQGIFSDPTQSALPGVVSCYDMRGNLVDRVTGALMDCNLLAVNGKKSVERADGSVFYVGEDTPRCNGEALLLAGEFTNLLAYSEDFSAASWYQGTASIAFVSDVTAPDNTSGVYRLDKTSEDSRVYDTSVDGVSTPHTFSVWLKSPAGIGTIAIALSVATTIVTVYPDRWVRVEVTHDFATAGDATCYAVDWRDGGTLDSVYAWGAQLVQSKEKGPYIPTEGAPRTFATEQGSADNGISAGKDDFPEIWSILQSGEGTMRFKLALGFDKADAPADSFAPVATRYNSNTMIRVAGGAGTIQSYGGNYAYSNYDYSADEEMIVDVSWKYGGQLRLWVNEVEGTAAAFDGWDLSADKALLAYNLPDGTSMKAKLLSYSDREAAYV